LGIDRFVDLHLGAVQLRIFYHDDGIGAIGHRGASRHLDAAPGEDATVGALSGVNHLNKFQNLR